MTTTRAMRAAVAALSPMLVLGLVGCGTDQPTTKGPSSASPSPSATESASPSATTSASPTTAPLSRFEDNPAVQAARAWARAYATDVNNHDAAFAAMKPLSTPSANLAHYTGTDFQRNSYYPGPLPFTPVAVKASGGHAVVVSCAQTDGWDENRQTHQPNAQRKVSGLDFDMVKTSAGWKLSGLPVGSTNCSNVNVKGIPW